MSYGLIVVSVFSSSGRLSIVFAYGHIVIIGNSYIFIFLFNTAIFMFDERLELNQGVLRSRNYCKV